MKNASYAWLMIRILVCGKVNSYEQMSPQRFFSSYKARKVYIFTRNPLIYASRDIRYVLRVAICREDDKR